MKTLLNEGPSGEMVDAVDSKSTSSDRVLVRVRSSAINRMFFNKTFGFFLIKRSKIEKFIAKHDGYKILFTSFP